jgi:hypothetical protein
MAVISINVDLQPNMGGRDLSAVRRYELLTGVEKDRSKIQIFRIHFGELLIAPIKVRSPRRQKVDKTDDELPTLSWSAVLAEVVGNGGT